MDGVIVDNYSFHATAWETFCNKYNLDFQTTFRSNLFGGTNKDHLEAFFNKPLTMEEIARYEEEKESLYREIYKDHIQPVEGLLDFLRRIKNDGIPCALATSSPAVNVRFVLSSIGAENYFNPCLDASHVKNGKPDPEIYLKAAKALHLDPAQCIVFEDSVKGVDAAKKSGAHVVGLATTHSEEELPAVDLCIPDFTDLELEILENLL